MGRAQGRQARTAVNTALSADTFARVLGTRRGKPIRHGRPQPHSAEDISLVLGETTLEVLHDWCLQNLDPERPCGGVCVYRQGGIRVQGAAYAEPGAARRQASRRRRRLLNTRGVDAVAVLVELAAGHNEDWWQMNVEVASPGGRALTGRNYRYDLHLTT